MPRRVYLPVICPNPECPQKKLKAVEQWQNDKLSDDECASILILPMMQARFLTKNKR
jgi:hypothetical protein